MTHTILLATNYYNMDNAAAGGAKMASIMPAAVSQASVTGVQTASPPVVPPSVVLTEVGSILER